MQGKPKSIIWKHLKTKDSGIKIFSISTTLKTFIQDDSVKWYEEARDLTTNDLLFNFYEKGGQIYLEDVINEQTYRFPSSEKPKGYVLSFKLIQK